MNMQTQLRDRRRIEIALYLLGALSSVTVFAVFANNVLSSWHSPTILGVVGSVLGALVAFAVSLLLPRRKITVFITHIAKDRAIVMKVREALQIYGIRTVTGDDVVMVGDEISKKISNAIIEADFLVVILSQEATKSDWMKQEIAKAIENHKRIFPVLAENAEIPEDLRALRFADLRTDDKKELPLLARSLRNAARSERN